MHLTRHSPPPIVSTRPARLSIGGGSMTTAYGYHHYRDRTAMERAFRPFLVNHCRIHHLLTPKGREIPVLAIESDAAFRDLLRLHRDDDPRHEGGDLVVDTRVSVDTQRGASRVALKFTWNAPADYVMTLVFHLPKQIHWLRAALHHGGALCTPAPIQAVNSGLVLPFSHPDLAPHIALALTALAMYPPRTKARAR